MRLKLRHKVNGAILLTFAVIALIFSTIQLPFQQRRLQTMMGKVTTILETLVERDREPLANEIFEQRVRGIKIRLQQMLNVEGILVISVFDEAGKLLLSDGSQPVTTDLSPEDQERAGRGIQIAKAQWHGQSTLHYLQEIQVIGERIGFIEIYYSLADVESEQQLSLIIFSGLLGSIFLIMLILLNLILSRTIVSPITYLRDAMQHIRAGNLGGQVHVKNRDEIGDLSNTFNDMSTNLAATMAERDQAEQALRTLNEELEDRVNARTAELAQANAEIRALNEQLKDENLRMKTEMDLARRIQTSLLPQLVKDVHPDFEIAAVMLPADEVGGDYYDIALDREGHLWFGIGDVSGHGVTPGLIMMMAQTVHTAITTNYQASPRDVVIGVNNVLYKNVRDRLREDHFMTFTTLKYLGDGRFYHAGAHLDLIVHRRQTGACELIDTPGTWLNFIPDVTDATENSAFALDVGDTLVLYTDGLTEAWSPVDELLDMPRFLEIVQQHVEKDTETMRDAILADVLAWCKDKRDDDMSLVVVRRVQ